MYICTRMYRPKIYQSQKKSRIRETKHLSTNADSSTNTIVGWTKNTPKPFFLKNGKIHKKNAKIRDTLFNQRSVIHWEA